MMSMIERDGAWERKLLLGKKGGVGVAMHVGFHRLLDRLDDGGFDTGHWKLTPGSISCLGRNVRVDVRCRGVLDTQHWMSVTRLVIFAWR